MLVGYAWVSTAGESLDLQKEALDRGGVDQLFADVASAANAKRPQLERALSQLRRGDTLVVWELDRLGRSLGHLIEMLKDFTHRGIGFRSLTENIDVTTTNAEFVLHAYTAFAQFKRDLIRQEIETHRAKAQARSRQRGPEPNLDGRKRREAVALH